MVRSIMVGWASADTAGVSDQYFGLEGLIAQRFVIRFATLGLGRPWRSQHVDRARSVSVTCQVHSLFQFQSDILVAYAANKRAISRAVFLDKDVESHHPLAANGNPDI